MFEADEHTANTEQDVKFIYELIQNLSLEALRRYLKTLEELERSLPTLDPQGYEAYLPQVRGDVRLAHKLLDMRELMDELADKNDSS
ncbi:MAG: hypothetical protein D6737_16200 [Chloroflexi bacterium]|nr:MAG: hypothetical protein D6737_16200 [Chloroflexota bacterium]